MSLNLSFSGGNNDFWWLFGFDLRISVVWECDFSCFIQVFQLNVSLDLFLDGLNSDDIVIKEGFQILLHFFI